MAQLRVAVHRQLRDVPAIAHSNIGGATSGVLMMGFQDTPSYAQTGPRQSENCTGPSPRGPFDAEKKQLTALSVWNSSGRAQSKLTPSEVEKKLPQRETQAHLHLEWLMLSFYWRPLGMLHQPAFDLRSHRLNVSTGGGHLCICRVGFKTGAACPRYI